MTQNAWLGTLALIVIGCVILYSFFASGEEGKERTCSDCGYRPLAPGESMCERCRADDNF